MSDTKAVEQRIGEIRNRLASITPGPWIPGRPDMQSYDAGTGEAFTNVYADDPQGRIHLGEPLPYTIARVHNESGRNKADAEFIGFAPSDIAFLLDQLDSIPSQIEAAVQAEREKWENVRNAGALLSNVAYNLSQQAGRVITEHDAELSRQCSDQWDAAIRARGETVK